MKSCSILKPDISRKERKVKKAQREDAFQSLRTLLLSGLREIIITNMKSFLAIVSILLSLFINAQTSAVTLSKEQLQNKIKGGWAGQTIGVTFGGPYEFQILRNIYRRLPAIEMV